jgi:hypothetical protein
MLTACESNVYEEEQWQLLNLYHKDKKVLGKPSLGRLGSLADGRRPLSIMTKSENCICLNDKRLSNGGSRAGSELFDLTPLIFSSYMGK